jgi:hypothetical protein
MASSNAAFGGELSFSVDQFFHQAASTSARRYRVFTVADNDSRGDVTHMKACERDHITSVQLALSARMLAE